MKLRRWWRAPAACGNAYRLGKAAAEIPASLKRTRPHTRCTTLGQSFKKRPLKDGGDPCRLARAAMETHGRCFNATGRKHGCQEFCRAREEATPLPCACPRAAESAKKLRNSICQLRRRAMPTVASRALLLLARRIPSSSLLSNARSGLSRLLARAAKPPSRASGRGQPPARVPSEAPPPGCAALVVGLCVCAARCACRAARSPAASCAQGPASAAGTRCRACCFASF